MSQEARPTSAQRAWTEQLDSRGSVEFFRSRRKLLRFVLVLLVFVLIGVVMVTTASNARDRLIGAACLTMFGLGLAMVLGMWFQRSAILTVDRAGVHVPRRTPVDIPWGSIVELGTWKVNKWGATQLLLRTTPELFDEWLRRMPAWQRTLFRTGQRTSRRNCVILQFLAVPEVELGTWIDELSDRLAPAVHDLVLVPEDHASPLFSTATWRPVSLEKLRLSSELTTALREFADRAAPVAEEIDEGGTPGAAWGYLAGEGRELCTRAQRELGAAASVVWFEDVPREKDEESLV